MVIVAHELKESLLGENAITIFDLTNMSVIESIMPLKID